MSGPVTSVARVEDVQIFLKDPVLYGIDDTVKYQRLQHDLTAKHEEYFANR